MFYSQIKFKKLKNFDSFENIYKNDYLAISITKGNRNL